MDSIIQDWIDTKRPATMLCSDARLAANRRNALRSTGPRTLEGKHVSRANAIKHGLCATIVQPEDSELIQTRALEIYESLKPQDLQEAWLVDRLAVWSVRIERCERIERRARDKICLYAELNWEDDRKLEAEALGTMLPERPAEVVEALRRTPQGCEWLMARWAMLARAAEIDDKDFWTEEQTKLAFDLLATPAEFRIGRPGETIDFEGKVLQGTNSLAAVARRQVGELRQRREVVAGLDEVEHALVMADMNHDSDPELRRLRRYESMLHNRIRWAVAQIKQVPFYRPLIPGLKPQMLEEPPPRIKPEPKSEEEKLAEKHPVDSIHPPFDLEPDEFPPLGQKADLPTVLRIRKQKRIKKAEAAREARRKRVDKLRA